jgi:uncharacterized protein
MPEHDPQLLVELGALLLAVGAFAGVLAGLLGVGGGIVLVPAFYFVFSSLGYESPQLMQLCVATSLATIIVTSARSVASHNRRGAVDWEILRRWAPGIVLGAALGVIVVSQLRTVTLQLIFGGLACTVGLYMALGKAHWRLGEEMPSGMKRAAIAPMIGGLSVLIGVGGGSFGVPLMTLHGSPIHRAVATAAGFGLLIAVPSVIGFLLVPMPEEVRPPLTTGLVNWIAFALVVAMTLLTAPLGARLAHGLDAVPLRRVFAVFLLLVAANMIRKALAG